MGLLSSCSTPLTVKNRFVFLPHTTGFVTADRLPDEREYHYLLERAKGGVGLIIEAGHVVHPTSRVKAMADAYGEIFVNFSQNGADRVTDNVERLTGHAPRSYEQFARDFAQVFGGGN